MDGLQAGGWKLVYEPDFLAHRRPRKTLGSFARMLMTYGRGRAEQFRQHPTLGSALNFVPPVFCIYFLCLPLALVWPWLLLPVLIYAVAVGLQVLTLLFHSGLPALLTTPLIVMTHILYGLGFWKGLFTRLGRAKGGQPMEVTLETSRPDSLAGVDA